MIVCKKCNDTGKVRDLLLRRKYCSCVIEKADALRPAMNKVFERFKPQIVYPVAVILGEKEHKS